MKRLLKSIFRPFWFLATPLRRKFNDRLDRSVRSAIQSSLALSGPQNGLGGRMEEIVVALDNLVAEVYRLQGRIEDLTQAIEERNASDQWTEAPLESR